MKKPKLSLLFAFALGLGVLGPRSARAADTVDVKIEILEASRTKKGFNGAVRKYQGNLGPLGYVGAQLLDTVTATDRAKGSRVELRFKDPARKERTIAVKVLEVGPDPRLGILIPDFRVSIKTRHKNGGVFFQLIPKYNLVLVVTPSN